MRSDMHVSNICSSQKHIWLWTTEPTRAERVAKAFYGFVSVGVIRSDSISFATLYMHTIDRTW